MTYQFLNNSIDINDVVLPNSDKIHPLLLKNDDADIKKALAFLATDEKFLHVHGFLGTGKRQFINYVADFVCEIRNLIIEIDGGQHNTPEIIQYDNNRTSFFETKKYKVIRFWNNDIDNNIEGVVEKILEVVE